MDVPTMPTFIHFLFGKELTRSDTSFIQCKLVIPKKDVKERFLPVWTHEEIKEGVPLKVFDMDEGREISKRFLLKYQERRKTYVFQYGWYKFVKTKNLNVGDTLEFRWNEHSKRLLVSSL